MKHSPGKRELVAMFMESPLYFELRVRERLALLRDHIRRFAFRASHPECGLVHAGQVEPTVCTATRPQADETGRNTKIIVGYFPPPNVPVGT